MNRANLKRRVLTGMLGGSLLLLSALHELSYLSVFVVIIFLSSREYYKILSNNGFKPNYNLGVFLSVVIFVTTYFYTSNESLIGIHFVLVPILPLVCLSALYSSDNHQTLSNVSVTFFGIFKYNQTPDLYGAIGIILTVSYTHLTLPTILLV